MKKEKEDILNNYIKHFTKEIKLNANNYKLYYKRGKIFFNLKKYKYAIADYDKAIDMHPNNINLYINRAKARAKLYDYKGAVEDIFTYFKLDGLNK